MALLYVVVAVLFFYTIYKKIKIVRNSKDRYKNNDSDDNHTINLKEASKAQHTKEATESLKNHGLKPYQTIRVNGRLRITYQDSQGAITNREIELHSFEPEFSDGLIKAHCFNAGDTRSFRVSRIQSSIDLNTGSSIVNLFDWLLLQFSETSIGKAEIFLRDNKSALSVLFHISRLDGQLSQSEKKAINYFMFEVGLDDEDSIKTVLKTSSNIYDMLSPTTYTKNLRNIFETQPTSYQLSILKATNEILKTNKSPNEDKLLALKKMLREFQIKEGNNL